MDTMTGKVRCVPYDRGPVVQHDANIKGDTCMATLMPNEVYAAGFTREDWAHSPMDSHMYCGRLKHPDTEVHASGSRERGTTFIWGGE